MKLYQAGLLPATYALKRLGYSDGEISEIAAARRADAMDSTLGDVQARAELAATLESTAGLSQPAALAAAGLFAAANETRTDRSNA